MRHECNTCHGIYEDVSPDGVAYFHACPPLTAIDLHELLNAGELQLDVDATAEVLRQPRRGEQETAHAFTRRIVAALADTRLVKRAGYRDENPARRRGDGPRAALTADGAGAARLPDLAAADAITVP